jgi:hypothetical protein
VETVRVIEAIPRADGPDRAGHIFHFALLRDSKRAWPMVTLAAGSLGRQVQCSRRAAAAPLVLYKTQLLGEQATAKPRVSSPARAFRPGRRHLSKPLILCAPLLGMRII